MDIGGVGSVYADYMASQASSGKADALQNKLTNNPSTATEEELMDACKEFESYFVEQMFKEMQKTVDVFSDGESNPNDTLVDFFKDNALQELASTSTEKQGLGLAQMLYEQMKRNYNL